MTSNLFKSYKKYIIVANVLCDRNNTDAVNNGVPLWGFYRTGGIIKIRIDNISPTIILSGLSTIYLDTGNNYIDQGVSVTDNLNANVIPYITSINNGITEPRDAMTFPYRVAHKTVSLCSCILDLATMTFSAIAFEIPMALIG